jgi:hypothetical protein
MSNTDLATVLGPTLAALITGSYLVFQNAKTNALAERRAEREREDAVRRKIGSARAAWAAAFQMVYVAAMSLLETPFESAEHTPAKKAYQDAAMQMLVAGARLLVVERDEFVRRTAHAYGYSLEISIPAQGDRPAAAERQLERLEVLNLGFHCLMKVFTGIATSADREQIYASFQQGSSIAPDLRQTMLAEMTDAARQSAVRRA